MDSAFLINEDERAHFIRFVFQAFGFTYACLWSYMPLPCNCLVFKDGMYHEETINNIFSPSSSSSTTSLAKILFDEYKNSVFFLIENETRSVPGLVFKNNLSYLELKDSDLTLLASIDLQRQFYREARIKKAIFMGCKNGVIELGFSNLHETQINMELEIQNWLRENDQNRVVSSSSSSLRSISMESAPEYPSFMYNVPTPSSYIPNERPFKDTPLILDNQTLRPISTNTPHQSQPATQALPINRFPALKDDIDEAMAKAMLVVISSSINTSSSSSSISPYNNNKGKDKLSSPFVSYNLASTSAPFVPMKSNNDLRVPKNMMKRVIGYYRSLNLRKIHGNNVQGINRPTDTQLHHMISERKRRVKLNESFQALRSFLPHGSKRDKASVLANTREYISALKAQVSELTQKNQLLETKLLSATCKEASDDDDEKEEESSKERLNVRITPTYESTSSERMVNLRVTTRGGDSSNKMDMMIRLLEFMKKIDNVTLLSITAETQMVSSSSSSNTIDRVVMRLKFEGNEWDENNFLEAVKRVVHDITP